MHRRHVVPLLLLLAAPALGTPAWAKRPEPPPAPAAETPAPEPSTRKPPIGAGLNTGGWDKQPVDFNGDGRPEIVNWVNGTNVRRKDTDLNRDGRMDVFTWFSGSGEIEAEEMDGDFDGAIDWVDHYQNGVRVKAEADVDFDGHVDVIFTYGPDGTVTQRERL